MSSWLTGLFDRVFAACGALLFAQAPMFIQQYSHQLSGRVAELKWHINAIGEAANLGQKSILQYIQRFIDSSDPDFSRQGELMQQLMQRYESLSSSLQGLSNASAAAKPFVFARNFNWEIAEKTLSEFQPGVPFTLEGLVYALIGVGVGYGFFSVIKLFFRLLAKGVLSCFQSGRSDVKPES